MLHYVSITRSTPTTTGYADVCRVRSFQSGLGGEILWGLAWGVEDWACDILWYHSEPTSSGSAELKHAPQSTTRNQEVNSLDLMNFSTFDAVHLAPLQVFLVIPLSIPSGIPIGIPIGIPMVCRSPGIPTDRPGRTCSTPRALPAKRSPRWTRRRWRRCSCCDARPKWKWAVESDRSLESWLVTVTMWGPQDS